MKKNRLFSVLVAMLGLVCELQAATVKTPLIRPVWSGAKVGTWTMDYSAALENAAASGKYTLMMYSGMWWCPHCQYLEENVLTTAAWKKFVKANGFYETVLDFPNRAGDGYWCWLWDNDFRKKAKLTAEDAALELVERYAVQDRYALEGGTEQTSKNVVVEVVKSGKVLSTNITEYASQPTSNYTRIGYPTILVIAPDGSVAGRFSPVKTNSEYVADPVAWVEAQINNILYPGVGNRITSAAQYDGFAVQDDVMSATVTIKTGKPNKDTNLAAISLVFAKSNGQKVTIKTSVYAAEGAAAQVIDKSGNEVTLKLDSDVVSGTFNGMSFEAFRNGFVDKDVTSISALESIKGIWILVADGAFSFETGCSSCGTYEEGVSDRSILVLNIGAKGKTKVGGLTSDGMKISFTAQLSYVDGQFVLPLMDAKKTKITGVLTWGGSGVATINYSTSIQKVVDFGRPANTLSAPLYYSDDSGEIVKLDVSKNKLSGAGNALKLTYTAKTGLCKGSYKVNNGNASITGYFCENVGYLFTTYRGGQPLNAVISESIPDGYTESSEDDDDCDDCHL